MAVVLIVLGLVMVVGGFIGAMSQGVQAGTPLVAGAVFLVGGLVLYQLTEKQAK
jgi:hypothetical protein